MERGLLNRDAIEIFGNIYYIPDTLIDKSNIPKEQYKCFKWIVALCIHNNMLTNKKKTLSKRIYSISIQSAEKIFCYITTGYADNINMSPDELKIFNTLPKNTYTKLNMNIIEKID